MRVNGVRLRFRCVYRDKSTDCSDSEEYTRSSPHKARVIPPKLRGGTERAVLLAWRTLRRHDLRGFGFWSGACFSPVDSPGYFFCFGAKVLYQVSENCMFCTNLPFHHRYWAPLFMQIDHTNQIFCPKQAGWARKTSGPTPRRRPASRGSPCLGPRLCSRSAARPFGRS